MSRDSAVNLDAALENSAEFVIDTFLQFIISSSSLFLSLRITMDMNNGNTTMTNKFYKLLVLSSEISIQQISLKPFRNIRVSYQSN